MFEQLEICQPGNYLPVTGNSGRELRPLQVENRGHISSFPSMFIYFPLMESPLIFLSIFSHYVWADTNGESRFGLLGISRCGVSVFCAVDFLPLVDPLSLFTLTRQSSQKKNLKHYWHSFQLLIRHTFFSGTQVNFVCCLNSLIWTRKWIIKVMLY